LDVSGRDKIFMDITCIRRLDILILLFFDYSKKNVGLQLDKIPKMHILRIT
jgi:hypothetical protein